MVPKRPPENSLLSLVGPHRSDSGPLPAGSFSTAPTAPTRHGADSSCCIVRAAAPVPHNPRVPSRKWVLRSRWGPKKTRMPAKKTLFLRLRRIFADAKKQSERGGRGMEGGSNTGAHRREGGHDRLGCCSSHLAKFAEDRFYRAVLLSWAPDMEIETKVDCGKRPVSASCR